MISGGTLPTNISEGGYGSAGEQPERLRSGEEGGVPPSPFSAHNVRTASPSNSLPPKAGNSRPEGGTVSAGETRLRRYPDGIFDLRSQAKPPSPPYLIGGDNCQKYNIADFDGTVGLDWIQGTVPLEHSAELYDYFSKMCGGSPEIKKWGRFRYSRHCVWHPYGISMYWDIDPETRSLHRNRFMIQLGGESLKVFDADSLYRLVKDLHDFFEFSATRIDLCFDDYEKIMLPHQVAGVAEQSNFTGFKRWKPEQERRVSGEYLSDQVRFGSRGKNGSGRFLRCYNKNLESGGEINSVRWEVEFSKVHAKLVFEKLCEAQDIETFAGLIGAIIGGSIDFIDRKGTHLDRMQRLEWWQRIRNILGCVKLRNPRRIKSIDNTVGWIETSVAGSFEKVRRAYGSRRFGEWLDNKVLGRALNKEQRAQVRDYWDKIGLPELSTPELPFETGCRP